MSHSLHRRGLPALVALALALGLSAGVPVAASAQDYSEPAPAASSTGGKKTGDQDLLYYLDSGEQERVRGDYERSRASWLLADAKVRGWEDEVRTDGAKILGDIGSFIINDKTRRYDGRDYEKVFLSVRLALDHLALGDWGAARTEIKKMHEREALISEFRSKELEAAKKESESKGIKTTSFKELNGYPIESLEDPEVRSLKNAYESAYANYIAGFVYEALGEPSLAAAGYRKAIEMRPGSKVLEDSLKGLDGRSRKKAGGRNQVDMLVLVETGSAPKIDNITIPIPLPIVSRSSGVSMVVTPISWPTIKPLSTSSVPTSVRVNDADTQLSLLTNVDVMARRAISDEMPGIIFRSAVRAIAKGVAQKAVQDNAGSLGMFGAILSVATSVVAVATETADDRCWKTLPAFYSVARATVPVGVNKLTLATPSGPQTVEVNVSGPYAVVALRSTDGGIALAQTPFVAGPAITVAEAEPLQAKGEAKADGKPGKKKK